MTEIMEKATTAIAEYSPTAAALADLRARFADVVFDVTTTKGDKEARAARMELVKLRTSLETKRKELKAPALERSRMIDSEAKRIEAEILALETPIDRQIKAEEERRERERQAKAEAERRRVVEIQERIDRVNAFPVRAAGKGSIVVEALLGDLVAIAVDETFAEFRPAAEDAHAQALATMRELLAAAQAHEEEARRLRAEREALEQQRREDEARRAEEDRIARAQHEAEVARVTAARKAEEARLAEARAAQEAELRLQREAEEARASEQRRIEAERQAEERRRLDAERAELERQQAEIGRQRREQEEREAAARAEAERIEQERIEAQRREELARERAADERMARLSSAAELMLRALETVRLSAAWPKLEPGTQSIVDKAIAATEREPAEA